MTLMDSRPTVDVRTPDDLGPSKPSVAKRGLRWLLYAFLIAVFLCFILYMGFELMTDFQSFGALEGPLKSIGIHSHYQSMSRGVVDLRDVLYYLATIVIFLLITRTVLQSRKW